MDVSIMYGLDKQFFGGLAKFTGRRARMPGGTWQIADQHIAAVSMDLSC
jgi:hypothetical protein